jgi:hypothetical protein
VAPFHSIDGKEIEELSKKGKLFERASGRLIREGIVAEEEKVHDCHEMFWPINDGTERDGRRRAVHTIIGNVQEYKEMH